MVPIEVLKMALEKEKEAAEFYTKMALEHASLKDILTDLANEEYKHKKLIEAKIQELTKC